MGSSEILELLRKDKIFQLHNSEILSSLKIPSYRKISYDVTVRLYSVLWRHDLFFTPFFNSGIPDLPQFPFFVINIKVFSCLRLRIKWLILLTIYPFQRWLLLTSLVNFTVNIFHQKLKCQWNSIFLSKKVFLAVNDSY